MQLVQNQHSLLSLCDGYGSGFVFLQNTPAPDALFGSSGVPPEQIGRCHTVYSPTSYLSGLADVGMSIDFSTSDGSGFTIGRRPYFIH